MKLHKDATWLAWVIVGVFVVGVAWGIVTDCPGTAGQHVYCYPKSK